MRLPWCTYNGSLYLHEQLNSLITQTYPVKELIIFDDASTDNTAENFAILCFEALIHKIICQPC